MKETHSDDSSSSVDSGIFSPIILPCGRVIPNRLVKVAMYEHLAALSGGPPNRYHHALYSTWSRYGWGMIVTGNVQVSRTHLTLGRDMIVPTRVSQDTLQPFKQLAAAIHGELLEAGDDVVPPLAIMQLSHAGRQSPNILGGRFPFVPPLAPSSVSVGSGAKHGSSYLSNLFNWLLFQTPCPMSLADIDDTVNAFVRGAHVAVSAGFDGIQLHVAHGYLLAQFMSHKTNKRADAYSADPRTSLHLLHRIISLIRAVVPSNFIIGVKVNAADYVDPTIGQNPNDAAAKEDQENQALEHLCAIATWASVDFIEISGGDYENPEFLKSVPFSKRSRQAFFAQFSHRAMNAIDSISTTATHPLPLILLTGGLRTPALLQSVLSNRHAHLLGIGRGSVLCPDLPRILSARKLQGNGQADSDTLPFSPEPDLTSGPLFLGPWLHDHLPRVPLIGAGIGMAWYVVAIRRLSQRGFGPVHARVDYSIGGIGAVLRMWLWVGPKGKSIRDLFASAINFVVFLAGSLLLYLAISFRS